MKITTPTFLKNASVKCDPEYFSETIRDATKNETGISYLTANHIARELYINWNTSKTRNVSQDYMARICRVSKATIGKYIKFLINIGIIYEGDPIDVDAFIENEKVKFVEDFTERDYASLTNSEVSDLLKSANEYGLLPSTIPLEYI